MCRWVGVADRSAVAGVLVVLLQELHCLCVMLLCLLCCCFTPLFASHIRKPGIQRIWQV
jgi:hypothetical protein